MQIQHSGSAAAHVEPPLNPKEETPAQAIERGLIGQTPSLVPLAESLAVAAGLDIPVLITGQTGTGKTYLARLLHECSPRRQHRFLVVPCGSIPANLVPSVFFGHNKGAFTGADQAQEGKLAAAGQGTLLLDEIDVLALEQQAILLRVLETCEYEPVGSNDTRSFAARIIAASNEDLEVAVEQGRFRRDLYYRLHVMAFHLPPLRERTQDIESLARMFVAQFARKYDKKVHEISSDTITALREFPWPGNIRQLENVVHQAVLASTSTVLLPCTLPAVILQNVNTRQR